MSYNEYIDMYIKTQKKDCLYRAFTFDVVNSRNQQEYLNNKNKNYFEFLTYVYSLLELEEQKTGKQILLKDEFNRKQIMLNDEFNSKLRKSGGYINGNNYNPMILGDMVTFFVYNHSITKERMLQIFAKGLKDFNIGYPFHFKTGVYQTNNYSEGGTKLYKGYMPQILESQSKDDDFVITKNYHLKIQENEKC